MTNILQKMEGYMVLDEDRTSDLIPITASNEFSIQIVVDSTNAVGEVKFQGSIDKTNFNDFNFLDENYAIQDGYDIESGASFSHIFDFSTATPFLRISYSSTSGTGGMDFYVHRKRGY